MQTSIDPGSGCGCSLPSDQRDERVRAWRTLAAEALEHRHHPGALVSRYPARADLARRLGQLVAAERECCPSLVFDLREQPSALRLEMRYPPEFTAMVSGIIEGREPASPG